MWGLTFALVGYIMNIEKGKTSNGYAQTIGYLKNNAKALDGWRYFFMEITKSNRINIKDIMYSLSISYHLLFKRCSITASVVND